MECSKIDNLGEKIYCQACRKEMHFDYVWEGERSSHYRYYCDCGMVFHLLIYDGVLTFQKWEVPAGYDMDRTLTEREKIDRMEEKEE